MSGREHVVRADILGDNDSVFGQQRCWRDFFVTGVLFQEVVDSLAELFQVRV